ncbi:MAG: patatin-like phospholipase family protein [Cyclobacteriaceae bacterium]|nr:patatin-like phospholipase family protein [Cyclobacteriaceae bacterium]
MTKKKIGFALSGGGARGIGHIGMIKALEQFDIIPQVLSGTSAGSIVSSLYSYGYSTGEMLKIIKSIKVFSSLKPSLSFRGLMHIESLGKILREYMPEDSFDLLKIPVTISATDLKAGKIVYFKKGNLSQSIMASCCIPVFFNPVEKDGMLLVDGGVLDNLPASVLMKKCDFLIGLHTNPISADFNVTNFKNLIERSLLMAINGNTVKSKEFCDAVIEPPEMGQFSGFDISKAGKMVDVAYDYTSLFLEKNIQNWEL